MTKTKHQSLREAILEMANDLRELGIMDEAAYVKITSRHADAPQVPSKPVRDQKVK